MAGSHSAEVARETYVPSSAPTVSSTASAVPATKVAPQHSAYRHSTTNRIHRNLSQHDLALPFHVAPC